MQSDWFVREVKRCREIGMPIGCCDEWPECSHVLAWLESREPTPDHFEGNVGANIAGGRHEADAVLGCCPHGVNLDRDFCPEGCRV